MDISKKRWLHNFIISKHKLFREDGRAGCLPPRWILTSGAPKKWQKSSCSNTRFTHLGILLIWILYVGVCWLPLGPSCMTCRALATGWRFYVFHGYPGGRLRSKVQRDTTTPGCRLEAAEDASLGETDDGLGDPCFFWLICMCFAMHHCGDD